MSTLAAARADNFYYPQNWDPKKGSLNKFHKSHPLGQRAKKIGEGILVIRYETPFHVRCNSCKNMIAKGVRFNAEKKCVGKFHTTKIWEFSMRCPRCANKIVVRTDPENCDYQYVEGAEKFLSTENATDVEFLPDPEDKHKMAGNPFYKLETQAKDRKIGEEEQPRIQSILEINDKWKDDYDVNAMLRKKFRSEKKDFQEKERLSKIPKNFALPLGETKMIDKLAAKKIRYKNIDPARLQRLVRRENIRTESIFKHHKDVSQQLRLKEGRLPSDIRGQLKREANLNAGEKKFLNIEVNIHNEK